ncbi:MAG: hypothetical protein A2Z88_00510 [Omnitrophica WOR_2 bacterium GWA2_47_8]|nr:MAG: hypothetical protein A2Z88_00510 [Omnitrophica WOR_2 bacterium GWA2_47_8]
MKTAISSKRAVHSHDLPYKSFDDLPLYDHRYLPRWEVDSRAYYRVKDTAVIIRTKMHDLSLTGVCMHVSTNVHANQKILLKMYLSDQVNLEAEGTVIWKRTLFNHDSYAGVMFDGLSQEKQALILEHAFERTG